LARVRDRRADALWYTSRRMASYVVGVAGGTGSGKSTVAERIVEAVPPDKVSILQHDNYYRDRPDLSYEERCQLNFDHPDSLETELLIEHLERLKAGEPIPMPVYDFKTHRRSEDTIPVEPRPVIVVEGILVFVDERLRALIDLKLFVDTPADIRVFRRIRRDLEHRGRTFASIREQYYASVRPMHLQFVEPSKSYADLIIPEGGRNRVALDLILAKLHSIAG
jgi:uridine kinase